MRKFFYLIIILMVVWGMISTNPAMDSYVEWCMVQINQQLQSENTEDSDPLGKLKQSIISWGVTRYGPDYIRANTKVENYMVATLFTSEVLGERIRVLGVVNQFIPISREKIE